MGSSTMSNETIKPIYRSIYTGQQIDELLTAIKFKVSSNAISNMFSDVGDPLNKEKISSAELCNILNERMSNIENPEFLKTIIDRIDDSNIFTDAHKDKLEGLSDKFKGVYTSKPVRDSEINTNTFIGGELCLLLNDGGGAQVFQYWDANTNHWKTANTVHTNVSGSVTLPTIGTVTFHTIDKSVYSTCELTVVGTKASSIHTSKILVTAIGSEIISCKYADLWNTNPLYTTNITASGNEIVLGVDTLTAGVTVRAKKMYEM